MGLTVEWVPYGRPAAEALRAAVATAKGAEPLSTVTVVVPSNHVGVATRRRLGGGALGPACGRGEGLAAVDFLTVDRLAELVGTARLAAAGRRPVSTPVVAAALRAELAADPGVFGPVAGHAATEAALVGAYRELRDVSPAALAAVAARSTRASDLVRLCRGAAGRLAPDWYDEVDLAAAAGAVLDEGGGPPGGLGVVVVYLPQRLTRAAGRLLAAVARRAPVAVLAGSTGVPGADAEVATSLARVADGSALPPLPAARPVEAPTGGGRARLVSASDPDDEVRAAVRAVVDAVRAGTPLDRMAILYTGAEPYARLVHEHLAAAGIPVNGAAVVPVAQRVAGRALLDLLAMAAGGFRRQDVFAWLAAAPVLYEGWPTPVVAWERLSRRAGVVAGRREWHQRLERLASELDARAEAADADPDGPAWLAARQRDDARRARSLRAFVISLMDQVEGAAAKARPWDEHAAWVRELLESVVGAPGDRQGWPAAERAAADRVERAIDRLGTVHTVEEAVDLDVFTRTLELELESDLGRVGRFGTGVLAGDVGMGLGLDLDLVVVLGLVEGAFPAPVREDSLLPDVEREAAGGELPLRRQRIDRQHRQFLAAVAGAGTSVLCVPRGDLRRTSERVPSRWALDVASALAGRRLWSPDLAALSAPWLSHVASFGAGLRSMARAATSQEHRLRSLLAGAAVDDAVLVAGDDVVTSRRSARFTRFDGHLAGLAVPSPAEGVTSPTRLERWATCPFAYLVEGVLGARPVENPEEQLTITPLDRGRLLHQALEAFILGVLERPAAERPAPHHPWPAADRARLAELGADLCDQYEARGLTGRAIFWRREREAVLGDLRRFLDADDEHRRSHGTRPLAAELAFGFPGAPLEAVPIGLPDGRAVHFRGLADRVDVGDDGTVHVVDYKSGGAKAFERLCADDPDLRGTKLQLAVYGAAGARLLATVPGAEAGAVHAEYWFVSAKGGFGRVGYTVTPSILERVGRNLSTMVAGIEAGVFPARPAATTNFRWVDCHHCDPDALGVTELRRAWDRKRADPALALYADLAEPFDDAGADAEVSRGA